MRRNWSLKVLAKPNNQQHTALPCFLATDNFNDFSSGCFQLVTQLEALRGPACFTAAGQYFSVLYRRNGVQSGLFLPFAPPEPPSSDQGGVGCGGVGVGGL